MSVKIGVIGLGNMGGGMAVTLASKGFDVSGFDLSEVALAQAKSKGVKTVTVRNQLIKQSDVLILSLPKAEHVEAVCLEKGGITEFGSEGLIVIDTTTSMPETSRKIASALRKLDIAFIDAPVSGGPKGAATGTMSMVIGAEVDDLARAMPVLEAMSATRVHIGGSGAGNVAKIANNMLAACHLISTAEAIAMAAKAEVAPEKLVEGLNAGSGRSAASQVMFPTWVLNKAYDSGFTMGLMRKDVGLASELANGFDLDLPLSHLVASLWKASSATLADNEDFCAIVQCTDTELFGRGD
ncbi:3-hydroxyisobutyrate dehydrogenase [Pseudomonas gessardii]|uniref:NAD(P)-dependent oxidoreductase n=1 Tax=Pseudomonas gessardii TaxID=78544 RepID=UPI00088FE9DF|nr:NAD(P)-dependent oxidoreductase [Pseudomonas gessardii]MRU54459.1 NAD(P)-dependent oxidoreductase [Pseudomonas gessardii]ONH35045.1 3-hydroxyisobutyrate dehydrogenase [Pseudomonas gessardii]SDQ72286.1 3-hydroxyisobutyrate dehydrogenase [Pseudomonas gessardii]